MTTTDMTISAEPHQLTTIRKPLHFNPTRIIGAIFIATIAIGMTPTGIIIREAGTRNRVTTITKITTIIEDGCGAVAWPGDGDRAARGPLPVLGC